VVSAQSTFRQQHCNNYQCNGVCVTNITMPCGQCIPCSPNASVMCVSAIVNCHLPENETIQEALYMTQNCTGEPYRTIKPDLYNPSASYCYKWQDFWVHNICPSEEEDLGIDLSRFVPKLLKDEPEKFKTASLAWSAIFEYKRFLAIKKTYLKIELSPSPLVDEVWHMHILDTKQYMKDCDKLFGFYLHHAPSFGTSKEEKSAMGSRYSKTLQVYESLFKEPASVKIWPRMKSASCGSCSTADKADCGSCSTVGAVAGCGTCSTVGEGAGCGTGCGTGEEPDCGTGCGTGGCGTCSSCFYPSCCA